MFFGSADRRTNWWGLSSAFGLFAWFFCWFKNEPRDLNHWILFWTTLVLIHWLASRAARRRLGWIYLIPFALLWTVAILALTGAMPQ